MTALYKIVQDDHPPLPDRISQALRDFLLQCFKKQAQVRERGGEAGMNRPPRPLSLSVPRAQQGKGDG